MKRIFIIICLVPLFLNAQHISDEQLVKNSVCEKHTIKNTDATKQNVVVSVFLFPIWIYKQIISEQLSAQCQFSPSCSTFGKEAIRTFGPIKGIFLTADRITRCHGNAHEETESYLKNSNNGTIEDSPCRYSY